MVCEFCGGPVRGDGPAISGTRDGFGIRNEFKDDQTGESIDTWKKWEKRGYRNPVEVTKDHQVKEKIKDKIHRVKTGLKKPPKKENKDGR